MSALLRFSGLLICCLITNSALADSAALQRCLNIDNDSQRLSCYDNALGRSITTATQTPAPDPVAPIPETATAEAPTRAPSLESATPAPSAIVVEPSAPAPATVVVEQPVTQQPPAPVSEAPVAQQTPATPAQPAEPAKPAQIEAEFGLPQETDWEAVKDDRITAAVVDVDKTPLGAIIVELDNKHVWRQVDDKRLTLRKGDEVTIRGGMGGSFYLAKTSGSRSLRVKRIK